MKDIDYLCDECAKKLGWRWPKHHGATAHQGACDVCGEKKWLTCWNDWLRGEETEIPAERWD